MSSQTLTYYGAKGVVCSEMSLFLHTSYLVVYFILFVMLYHLKAVALLLTYEVEIDGLGKKKEIKQSKK